jgi:hypothetical protein
LPGNPARLAADRAAEGWRQWNGGEGKARSWEARSALALAWWTDPLGRKHCRVLARRGRFARPYLDHLLDPTGEGWPPLALVYPALLFFARRAEQRALLAVCACGACATPERLGWMGPCCALCHDLEQEGRRLPPVGPTSGRMVLPGAAASSYLGRPVLACSADAQLVAVSDGRGGVTVWDVLRGTKCWTLRETAAQDREVEEAITCAAVDASGHQVITGSRHGQVSLWQADTGEGRRLFRVPGWVHAVARSPDGTLVAVANAVSGVSVRPLEGSVRHERLGGLASVHCLAFSPDGTLLTGGNWEGRVRLWEVATGTERPGPDQPGGDVHSLSFAPDGLTLAAGTLPRFGMAGQGEPRPVLLWDMSRQCLRRSLGGAVVHHCAAFAPDGRSVVTGDEDRQVRVWDAATGEELGALGWHQSPVWAVAFSADGRLLATLGLDGTARLWSWQAIRPGAWTTSPAASTGSPRS